MNAFIFVGRTCSHCKEVLTKDKAATWRCRLEEGVQRFFCSNHHYNLYMAQGELALDRNNK